MQLERIFAAGLGIRGDVLMRNLLYGVMFLIVIFLISTYDSSRRFTCAMLTLSMFHFRFLCVSFILLEGINRWAGVGAKGTVKQNERSLSSNSGETD